MVSDDAETDVVLVVGAVLRTGEPLSFVDNRTQQIGFVDVVDTLQQKSNALDAHTGIDVLLRQRAKNLERVLACSFATLVFHEDEVPNLDVAILVRFWATVSAVLRAAVVENL